MKKSWGQETFRGYSKRKPVSRVIRENISGYGLKKEGLSGILSALLGNIPDETLTVLLAKEIRGLANITPVELEQLPGIGREKALRLLSAVELSKMLATAPAAERPAVTSPEEAARLVMEEMRYLDQEQFRILHLNTKKQVIGQKVVTIGTLSSSLVHPREVFKDAIRDSSAAIILVHNHPSGDPTPSNEDGNITKRLVEAGQLLGIEIIDHLVIGDGRFISFRSRGLM